MFADDVHWMHVYFEHSNAFDKLDADKLKKLLAFRLAFLDEELRETRNAESADEVVDGLIDLIVVAIGTLDAFQVDVEKAWKCVHQANMSKASAVNPNRPNEFGLPDLIKPPGWQAPCHKDNTGRLKEIF